MAGASWRQRQVVYKQRWRLREMRADRQTVIYKTWREIVKDCFFFFCQVAIFFYVDARNVTIDITDKDTTNWRQKERT